MMYGSTYKTDITAMSDFPHFRFGKGDFRWLFIMIPICALKPQQQNHTVRFTEGLDRWLEAVVRVPVCIPCKISTPSMHAASAKHWGLGAVILGDLREDGWHLPKEQQTDRGRLDNSGIAVGVFQSKKCGKLKTPLLPGTYSYSKRTSTEKCPFLFLMPVIYNIISQC